MKNKSPFTVKVDSEISLRIRTKDEALELFNLVKENKKHLSKFLYWVNKNKKISDSEDFIIKNFNSFKEGINCDLGIYLNDVMIGSGGYHILSSTNRNGEIGYWIAKQHEGKGIMTKVVKKLIEIGKKKYNLHRIEIRVDPINEKSKAIPKRLGFTHEATLRDNKFIKNKFRGTEVWGLLV